MKRRDLLRGFGLTAAGLLIPDEAPGAISERPRFSRARDCILETPLRSASDRTWRSLYSVTGALLLPEGAFALAHDADDVPTAVGLGGPFTRPLHLQQGDTIDFTVNGFDAG